MAIVLKYVEKNRRHKLASYPWYQEINKKMDILSGLIFEDIKEEQKYKNYLLRVEKVNFYEIEASLASYIHEMRNQGLL